MLYGSTRSVCEDRRGAEVTLDPVDLVSTACRARTAATSLRRSTRCLSFGQRAPMSASRCEGMEVDPRDVSLSHLEAKVQDQTRRLEGADRTLRGLAARLRECEQLLLLPRGASGPGPATAIDL